MPVPATPPVERILARSERTAEGCLVWLGARTKYGYGIIQLGRGIGTARTHRVMYAALHGDIPAGMTIDHRCGNPSCVEVNHMDVVTRRENVLRQWSAGRADPGRSQREKTHCVNGHPFDASNTHIARSGQRVCRACARENMRRSRAKRKAQA